MLIRYKVRIILLFVKVFYNLIMFWREFLCSNVVNYNVNLVCCVDSVCNLWCWCGLYCVLKLKNGGIKVFGEDLGYDNW